jgi:hypothetical protein
MTTVIQGTTVQSISISEAKELLKQQGYRVKLGVNTRKSVREYLLILSDEELRQKFVAFYDAHPFFEKCPAGAKHHHWWESGLSQHCVEMLGLAEDLFTLYPGKYTAFTFDEVTQAVFLHDFPKIWWYRLITDEERISKPDKFKENQVFTYTEGADHILDAEGRLAAYLMRWLLAVSDRVWSAVLFAEGGFSKSHFKFGGVSQTSANVGKNNPLTAFIHCLDLMSSQIWGGSDLNNVTSNSEHPKIYVPVQNM